MSEAAIVEVVGDRVVYRASALGGCQKALIAARVGFDALEPKVKPAFFEAGNKAEDDWFAAAAKTGRTFTGQQMEVTLQLTGNIAVVGHIDGLEIGKDRRGDWTIEVKSMSGNEWAKVNWQNVWAHPGLVQKYKWQMSVYILAREGRPLNAVFYNRDTGETKEFLVKEPWYTVDDVRARVLAIEVAAREADLPQLCDIPSYPCPYFYLHEDQLPEELVGPELQALAGQYYDAQQKEKVAKAVKDQTKLSLMKNLGVGKYESGEWKVTVYEARNPPSYDMGKMAEDGVDVLKYQKITTSTRLRITRKEMGDGTDADGE